MHTRITTIQHLRDGKVVRQKHQAILTPAVGCVNRLEAPTLSALQRKVEAAGGRFARNEIGTIRKYADPDFY